VNDYAEHMKLMQREVTDEVSLMGKTQEQRQFNSEAEDLLFEERREREKKLKGLLIRQMLRNKQSKDKSQMAKCFGVMRGYNIGATEAVLDNSAAMSENSRAVL